MYNCECETHHNHVNTFIDLNGVPYILAEYMDRNSFQQIDRSQIKSEINVDKSDAMRAIIDVSIDDIGRRASDGYPNIIGNNAKIKKLLKMINDSKEMLDGNLSVLRRGIVVRVDYQLENYTTRQVIRSMTETFRIIDRNYFLDINPRNIQDNAIIVNFCNTLVSTITEFTHGQDPMMFRVTNIHLSYEVVKPSPKMPRVKQTVGYKPNQYPIPNCKMSDNDIYCYHDAMQNHHVMPSYDPNSYMPEDPNNLMPSNWAVPNRFYHFDLKRNDIILNGQEINDPMTKTALIPCGTIRVNKAFMINPGHRIIFKFCIWKNDVSIVDDIKPVAQALGIPTYDYDNSHNCGHIECNHHCNPIPPVDTTDQDYINLLRMIQEMQYDNRRQTKAIIDLRNQLGSVMEIIKDLTPPEEPIEPEEPEEPGEECCESCEDVKNDVEELDSRVDDLENKPNVVPLDNETISDIVNDNSQQ